MPEISDHVHLGIAVKMSIMLRTGSLNVFSWKQSKSEGFDSYDCFFLLKIVKLSRHCFIQIVGHFTEFTQPKIKRYFVNLVV